MVLLICKYIKENCNSEFIVDVDLVRDRVKIIEQFIGEVIDNSFGTKFPQKVKYWDSKKNGSLTPYMFSPGSRTVIAWTCDKCNNTWFTGIKFFSKAKLCPKCHVRLD